MVIGVQNQLPITFCSDLVCNKKVMVRNSTPTPFLTINILLHIKSEQKVIRK